MNGEEIQETIKRLKKVRSTLTRDVGEAFMGRGTWTGGEFRDALIELLETARDSIPLPKDKNGETIHMDDMVEACGYRYPIRRLFYLADKGGWRVGGSSNDPLSFTGLYAPEVLRHYHAPTIDDVMREFYDKWNYAVDNGDENVTAALIIECAEKLREVMDA